MTACQFAACIFWRVGDYSRHHGAVLGLSLHLRAVSDVLWQFVYSNVIVEASRTNIVESTQITARQALTAKLYCWQLGSSRTVTSNELSTSAVCLMTAVLRLQHRRDAAVVSTSGAYFDFNDSTLFILTSAKHTFIDVAARRWTCFVQSNRAAVWSFVRLSWVVSNQLIFVDTWCFCYFFGGLSYRLDICIDFPATTCRSNWPMSSTMQFIWLLTTCFDDTSLWQLCLLSSQFASESKVLSSIYK